MRESIVYMNTQLGQVVKHLYSLNFEWPDIRNGPINMFLYYAETPALAEAKAREIHLTKARDMRYLGVEALPDGIVCSPTSRPKPGTIVVDAVLEARKG
jgi:hypothetical protein